MRKIKNALVGGSIVLLISFNLFNLFNFLFQFSMARMLSLADYGILATLISFIYLINILTESIQLVVAKYVSNEKDNGKIKFILKKTFNVALYQVSILIFCSYMLVTLIFSYFMDISFILFWFNGLIIFMACLLPINRGILQGTKRFNTLGLNMIIEGAVKLIFAVLFVYIGYGVYGAVGATLLGAITAFIFSLTSMKDVLSSKEKWKETPGIRSYSVPVFVVMSAIIAMYSIDIIIAKLIFASDIAGSYAIASTLGKIIIWGTLPISKTMFPLSAEKSKQEPISKKIYKNSFFLLTLLILIVLLAFYLVPEILVKIFSGKNILDSAAILFYIGVGMSFIALANLNLMYKLSIGRTKGYILILLFVLIEAIMLFTSSLFFSKSLEIFSITFSVSSLIFLIGTNLLLRK